MGSRPQWESITRAVAGEQSETYLRIPRGGFALGGKGVAVGVITPPTIEQFRKGLQLGQNVVRSVGYRGTMPTTAKRPEIS